MAIKEAAIEAGILCACCGLWADLDEGPMPCGHYLCYICWGRGHDEDHKEDCPKVKEKTNVPH
jgi:hypothetical protein